MVLISPHGREGTQPPNACNSGNRGSSLNVVRTHIDRLANKHVHLQPALRAII